MSSSHLVLASASPRRIAMLTSMGLSIQVHPADIDETPRMQESPEALVLRLSKEKTLAVRPHYPNQTIIGADTMVFCKGSLLGKPAHEGAAKQMLQLLSNDSHEVYTGYCIDFFKNGQHQQLVRCIKTTVQVKPLSQQEIRAYLESQEWRGKAGGYGIQGKFSLFVQKINGSMDAVLGLPLCQLIEDLEKESLLPDGFPTWSI